MDERTSTASNNAARPALPLDAIGAAIRAALTARRTRGGLPTDEELDQLQARIWGEIRAVPSRPGLPPPAVEDYAREAMPDVSFALDECDLLPAGYRIDWRNPLLGPANAALRRQINAEVRRYVDPALARQTRLNYRLTELLQRLVRDHDIEAQRLRDQLGPVGGLRMEVDALRAEAAALGAKLTGQQEAVASARAEAVAARAEATAARATAAQAHAEAYRLRVGVGTVAGAGATGSGGDTLPVDYLAYNARVGGAIEHERALYAEFVPLFAGAAGPVVDLGCGRGPFLDLLRDAGVPRLGVDGSPEMAADARSRGHEVVESDALAFVAGTADGALGGLFAAHLIEHLPRAALVRLIGECRRALAPGAYAVFISPDPRSLFVLSDTFYKDLTHVAPIHPAALTFLVDEAGFASNELRTLSPVPADRHLEGEDTPGAWTPALQRNLGRLEELIFGDLDYALIARR